MFSKCAIQSNAIYRLIRIDIRAIFLLLELLQITFVKFVNWHMNERRKTVND